MVPVCIHFTVSFTQLLTVQISLIAQRADSEGPQWSSKSLATGFVVAVLGYTTTAIVVVMMSTTHCAVPRALFPSFVVCRATQHYKSLIFQKGLSYLKYVTLSNRNLTAEPKLHFSAQV